MERQKTVVLSEMRQSCVSPGFQCEKGAVLAQLGTGCAAMAPKRESVVAMAAEVAEASTRVRRFAADSACNVHLTGDEGDLSDQKNGALQSGRYCWSLRCDENGYCGQARS